ncbi:glycoside hydrolase family 36 protein [Actinoplanes sp. NPDC000266]
MTDVVWVPGETTPRRETPVAPGLRANTPAEVRHVGPAITEATFRPGRDELTFTVTVPATDAVAWWRPGSTLPHATIPPSWADAVDSSPLQGLPLGALLAGRDRALLAYAVDAGTGSVHVRAGLVEETAEFVIMVTATGADEVRLYLDSSSASFSEAVTGAGRWLQGAAGHLGAPGAEDPVLCTWYFAHQHVTADAVLDPATRAAELGFGTVIIDDGWQTTDHGRGYSSAGDWTVAEEKFPDPAGLVTKLREAGLRTMWWIGTPFIGHRSQARDLGLAVLADDPALEAQILDPRDAAARAHLVSRIRDLVAGTGADGVKLDFFERFGTHTDAVVQLMDDVVTSLRELGPEPLIEFREPYIHPAVGRYASMIRVGDCPLSAAQNRVGILDLRLARPGVPIHSDPIMWAPDDTAERVAYHLINALLGVPQVSVDLLHLPAPQAEALAFWLGFWREHRDLLLHGRLTPHRPDLLYPQVTVSAGEVHLVARYAPYPINLADCRELLIANADDSPAVVLNAVEREVILEIRDARGRLILDEHRRLAAGPVVIDVPAGGLARLRQEEPR